GEDQRQLRRPQLDAVLPAGVGQLEGAGLEALVPDRQAIVVEVEGLEAIPAAVDEEEEMAIQEGLAEALLDQARGAVEALAHVHRSRAEEDADGRGERDHGATSRGRRPGRAATSRPSHSGSGAVSQRRRTWCGSSISKPRPDTVPSGWGEGSRWSGTNRGDSAGAAGGGGGGRRAPRRQHGAGGPAPAPDRR